jgi:hypothetical protein
MLYNLNFFVRIFKFLFFSVLIFGIGAVDCCNYFNYNCLIFFNDKR